VSSRPAPRRASPALIVAVLALLTAILVVVFVLRLASNGTAKVQLGTDSFVIGPAARLAPTADRAPLLFQALRGTTLDIYVQHLGADPIRGWLAFQARRQGAPRTCTLQWQARTGTFLDPCDHQTYPPDGAGLPQFRVTIDSRGRVTVNLQASIGTTPEPT
jgi:hypothetical protein